MSFIEWSLTIASAIQACCIIVQARSIRKLAGAVQATARSVCVVSDAGRTNSRSIEALARATRVSL